MKKKFTCKVYHCYKYFQEPTFEERLVDVKLVSDGDYQPLNLQECHRYFVNLVRREYTKRGKSYCGLRLRVSTSVSRSNSVLSTYLSFTK